MSLNTGNRRNPPISSPQFDRVRWSPSLCTTICHALGESYRINYIFYHVMMLNHMILVAKQCIDYFRFVWKVENP